MFVCRILSWFPLRSKCSWSPPAKGSSVGGPVLMHRAAVSFLALVLSHSRDMFTQCLVAERERISTQVLNDGESRAAIV